MASSRFDAVETPISISISNSNSNSNSRPRRIELQAPRPASLMLREGSRTIDKRRKPVIIYMVSPKVIHAEASEFMSLVQRLTGPDSPTCNNNSSSETPKSFTAHRHSRHRSTQGRQFPVRVKARTLNPSRSIEALAHDHHQSRVPVQPISPTLFLRDLCSPSISGGSSLNWLLQGDDLLTPPSSLRGSQNYLDIFSQE
ncbi:uncharacterized protein LOC109718825 [Ananas comosus]|uniref:Uncharacterized protein LOC109718825 n=1 Tax=Ananas comosus TaxID=4615 RepID=A0A6P5FXT1_ANACO|nr:uncharacterized protein LOC109718825 [Ananas comosus]